MSDKSFSNAYLFNKNFNDKRHIEDKTVINKNKTVIDNIKLHKNNDEEKEKVTGVNTPVAHYIWHSVSGALWECVNYPPPYQGECHIHIAVLV